MLASHSMAEDDTMGAVQALNVRAPIQLSAAVIVLDLLCIARPASLIIAAMNLCTSLRYCYHNPTSIVVSS
jgi:hypothetical protein